MFTSLNSNFISPAEHAGLTHVPRWSHRFLPKISGKRLIKERILYLRQKISAVSKAADISIAFHPFSLSKFFQKLQKRIKHICPLQFRRFVLEHHIILELFSRHALPGAAQFQLPAVLRVIQVVALGFDQ